MIAQEPTLKAVRKSDNFVSSWLSPVYHEDEWKVKLQPLNETNLNTIKYFDSLYGKHYGIATWSTMRAALLCPPAKVALINRFYQSENSYSHSLKPSDNIDVIKVLKESWKDSKLQKNWKNRLNLVQSENPINEYKVNYQKEYAEMIENSAENDSDRKDVSNFVPCSELICDENQLTSIINNKLIDFEFSKHLTTSVKVFHDLPDEENDRELPDFLSNLDSLNILARVPGKYPMLFNPPTRNNLTKKVDYYPLDLASVFSVFALGLKPGVSLLDLCAAPGGKSLVSIQTLNLGRLVCCDSSPKRLERLRNVLLSHSHEMDLEKSLKIELSSFQEVQAVGEKFDRILVDAPCYTDRHVLTSDMGSVFSKGRNKEKLNLPLKQKALLIDEYLNQLIISSKTKFKSTEYLVHMECFQKCICFFKPVCYKILVLGLDSAGKISIIQKMKLKDMASLHIIPTLSLCVWDLGGQEITRVLWKHHFIECTRLIFVVDSSDNERLSLACSELHSILSDSEKAIPLCTFANKQDKPKAFNGDEIKERLRISELEVKHNCHIHPCSANTHNGILVGFIKISEFTKDALKMCKVGGSVVYSTCTLSPLQNQHVIDQVLEKMAEDEPESLFGLVDLGPLAKLISQTKALSSIWTRSVLAPRPSGIEPNSAFRNIPIGIQILPTISANYGPAFISKIRRYR